MFYPCTHTHTDAHTDTLIFYALMPPPRRLNLTLNSTSLTSSLSHILHQHQAAAHHHQQHQQQHQQRHQQHLVCVTWRSAVSFSGGCRQPGRDGWMNEWMNGWTGGRVDGLMDGWMGAHVEEALPKLIKIVSRDIIFCGVFSVGWVKGCSVVSGHKKCYLLWGAKCN